MVALLAAGAEANATNEKGQTALSVHVSLSHTRSLLSHAATDLLMRDEYLHGSIRHYAASKARIEVGVACLICYLLGCRPLPSRNR